MRYPKQAVQERALSHRLRAWWFILPFRLRWWKQRVAWWWKHRNNEARRLE